MSDAIVKPNSGYVNVTVRLDPNWTYIDLWKEVFEEHLHLGAANPHKRRDGVAFTALFIELEEGFEESFEANYSETDVVGRAEAYMTYTGGSNKEVPLTFQFHVQDGSPLAEVVRPARWLDSLKLPVVDIKAKVSHAPPPLLLQVGSLLIMRCVLATANIQWKSPFEPGTMYPHGAEVQCTFRSVRSPASAYGGLGDFRYLMG